MFSTTVAVILAVGFISFVSGLESAHEAVLKCFEREWRRDVSIKQSEEGPKTEDEIIEAYCESSREVAQCIININPNELTSNNDLFHFFVAYQWQHIVIAEKAGLCKDMQTDELKKIAMESGIMERENLLNVEKHTHEACVADAMRKCIIRGASLNKLGISQNLLSSILDYINCHEEARYSCEASMQDHLITFLKAYKKYLEQNQGEFGRMAKKVNMEKKVHSEL